MHIFVIFRRQTLLFLLLFGGALTLATCTEAEEITYEASKDLVVTTTSGKVAGFYAKKVRQWRGIPFAAPPLGDLRWRAPRPVMPWTEVRDATRHSAVCIQMGHPLGSGATSSDYGKPVGSEDCLYLNIFAPDEDQDSAPVMVWIHGGSNLLGSASDYDFSALARAEKVIVVTINYRLGVFGWFSHAALRDGASPQHPWDRSSNFALMDMIAALRWVQDNIAAFGGNPKRVTLFGESAGGRDVLALIASPVTAGLLHGGIAQSGSTRSYSQAAAEAEELAPDKRRGSGWLVKQWQRDHPVEAVVMANPATQPATQPDTKKPQKDAVAVVVAGAAPDVAVAPDAKALRTSRWMRSLDAGYVLLSGVPEDNPDIESGLASLPRLHTIIREEEEIIMPRLEMAQLYVNRKYQPVPLMLGTNRDEMKLFMASDPALVDNWFGVQYLIQDEVQYNRISDYLSRSWKETGADWLATHIHTPTWVYRFDWDEEPTFLLTDFGKLFGAAHAFEIPFMSGSMSLKPSLDASIFSEENLPAARQLSTKMMAYWAEFARLGLPSRGGNSLPLWPSYKLFNSYLVFDTEAGGGVRLERDREDIASLLAALAVDEEVADTKERCSTAWSIFETTEPKLQQALADYGKWHGGICGSVEPVIH